MLDTVGQKMSPCGSTKWFVKSHYDRASIAAVITTAKAMSRDNRGSQRAVLNTTCSPAVR